MKIEEIQKLDWNKTEGLMPAVIQHARTGAVLMLGFMNREALQETLERGQVVFYSRSRQQRWLKGETSGNYLDVISVAADCDKDSLLILAEPHGPVCHEGTPTCFPAIPPTAAEDLSFLNELQAVIAQRIADRPEGSYTAKLLAEGPARLAQKIGEEGVEIALAAVTADDEAVVNESADLMYHLLLLMKSRNLSLAHVVRKLESRHRPRI